MPEIQTTAFQDMSILMGEEVGADDYVGLEFPYPFQNFPVEGQSHYELHESGAGEGIPVEEFPVPVPLPAEPEIHIRS